jgi:SAM-dependent methyltransferase
MAAREAADMSPTLARKPYQGLVQIMQFNWRSYVGTAMGVSAALLALPFLPPIGRAALLLGVAPAIFWLASSLIVSHYVYDRFPLYDLSWILRTLPRAPRRWINIHCGFDETSDLLTAIFPESAGQAVDIFDPHVMTEASIHLARHNKLSDLPATAMHYDALALSDSSLDAAFLIFAAHELRRHEQRVKLFREIVRILVPGGDLILMEHARDGWNFLAFGPGFLHFFSKHEWRRAASEAGLTLQTEFTRTPFIHVYILRRAA